ncbi:MAG: conjugal transfer protein TraF, partial [Aestuariibacter sp.]|nr:conjugal transfer protein TraF [Aestuariibacter sp.]
PTESSEKTEGPPMFSVLWLKEQLPALRQRALDQPTDRNLRTYLYAQRMMVNQTYKAFNTETQEKDPEISNINVKMAGNCQLS